MSNSVSKRDGIATLKRKESEMSALEFFVRGMIPVIIGLALGFLASVLTGCNTYERGYKAGVHDAEHRPDLDCKVSFPGSSIGADFVASCENKLGDSVERKLAHKEDDWAARQRSTYAGSICFGCTEPMPCFADIEGAPWCWEHEIMQMVRCKESPDTIGCAWAKEKLKNRK